MVWLNAVCETKIANNRKTAIASKTIRRLRLEFSARRIGTFWTTRQRPGRCSSLPCACGELAGIHYRCWCMMRVFEGVKIALRQRIGSPQICREHGQRNVQLRDVANAAISA